MLEKNRKAAEILKTVSGGTGQFHDRIKKIRQDTGEEIFGIPGGSFV